MTMSELRFDDEQIRLSQEETRALASALREFHAGSPGRLAHLQTALERGAPVAPDRFERRELYEALYAATSEGGELPATLARLRGLLFSRLAAEEEGGISEATEATFAQEVVERSRRLPVLVYFWAPWCGPACRVLAPVLEGEVAAREGRVALVRIDVDAAPELATRLGVHTIPAVRAFVEGEVVAALDGPQRRNEVARLVDGLPAG